MADRSQRRAARSRWEASTFRGSPEEDDELYWLRVPVEQRARLTWELSRELFTLAARNGGYFDEETGQLITCGPDDVERRLPRSAFVLTRR